MNLSKRVNNLEARVPAPPCRTCAGRPIFDLSGDGAACPECGRLPLMFTIDLDRASGRGDDAA
jgi:hypothetical protein